MKGFFKQTPNTFIGVLLTGRHREMWHTERRRKHEDRGRNGSDAVTSQGMLAVTRSWKKQEELSLRVSGGSTALPTPWLTSSETNLRLLASRTMKKIHFYCFKSPSLWSFFIRAIRKLTQTGSLKVILLLPAVHIPPVSTPMSEKLIYYFKINESLFLKTKCHRDFPSGPVDKTPCSQHRGARVQSLAKELDPASCHWRVYTQQLESLHATVKTEDPTCCNWDPALPNTQIKINILKKENITDHLMTMGQVKISLTGLKKNPTKRENIDNVTMLKFRICVYQDTSKRGTRKPWHEKSCFLCI